MEQPLRAGQLSPSQSLTHTRRRDGATFLCPITKKSHDVCGILYVDDTDLIHLNMASEETPEEAHAALQASISSWSSLLIATGGTLKPETCYFYLISFVWDRNGKCSYAKNHLNPGFKIKVNLPGGAEEVIKHLAVDKELVTLGWPRAHLGMWIRHSLGPK